MDMTQVRTQSDLKSLCEVPKCTAEVATPILSDSITFHADEMLGLDVLKQRPESCSNGNLKFTSNVCLKASLHHNLRKRCPHYGSEITEFIR